MSHSQEAAHHRTVLVAGVDLAFRQVTVEDHTPTGAQLAAAAGFKPAQQATVLHMLPTGELEASGPTRRWLSVRGKSAFIITVRSDVPTGSRSRGTLRLADAHDHGPDGAQAGKVPARKESAQRQDHPDRVIGDTHLVHLNGNVVEFLYAKAALENERAGRPGDLRRAVYCRARGDHAGGASTRQGWFVFEGAGAAEAGSRAGRPDRPPHAGIERLRLTPRNVDNGEAPTPRRDFALLDADEDHLDRLGLRWETVLEGKRRWLLIHGYRMPSGYTVSNTELAIEVPPTYPQAALYGFYAYPPLARTSGGAIPSTQLRGTIRGREFHGWSRHRGASDP